MNDFTSTTATLTRRQAREIERRTGQRPLAASPAATSSAPTGATPMGAVTTNDAGGSMAKNDEQALVDSVRARLDRATAAARQQSAERLESEHAAPVRPAATVFEQRIQADHDDTDGAPERATGVGSAFSSTSGSTRAARPRTRPRRRMLAAGAGIAASAAALAGAGVLAPGVVAGGTEANLLSADEALDASSVGATAETVSAPEAAAPAGPLVPAPESAFDSNALTVTQFGPGEVDGAAVEAPVVTPAYVSPFPGGSMNEGYGTRGGAHNGIDVVLPGGGSCGAELQAISTGTVTFAGPQGSYGNHVEVTLEDGSTISYSHIEPDGIAVSVGQQVGAGDRIGSVGNTGRSTGCHLHFEVKVGGSFVDPVPWLAERGITL